MDLVNRLLKIKGDSFKNKSSDYYWNKNKSKISGLFTWS